MSKKLISIALSVVIGTLIVVAGGSLFLWKTAPVVQPEVAREDTASSTSETHTEAVATPFENFIGSWKWESPTHDEVVAFTFRVDDHAEEVGGILASNVLFEVSGREVYPGGPLIFSGERDDGRANFEYYPESSALRYGVGSALLTYDSKTDTIYWKGDRKNYDSYGTEMYFPDAMVLSRVPNLEGISSKAVYPKTITITSRYGEPISISVDRCEGSADACFGSGASDCVRSEDREVCSLVSTDSWIDYGVIEKAKNPGGEDSLYLVRIELDSSVTDSQYSGLYTEFQYKLRNGQFF